jgi:hypothetical protein
MAETRWVGHGSDWPEGHRQCTACGQLKSAEEFHKHAQCKGGRNSVCKVCRIPKSKANYQQSKKELRLFNAAKGRAAAKGREFNLELQDIVIPERCPVLGIPMTRPSLDRIDNNKGYVKGNVRVISYRANVLKNDATVEELTLVLNDLKRIQAGVCEIL